MFFKVYRALQEHESENGTLAAASAAEAEAANATLNNATMFDDSGEEDVLELAEEEHTFDAEASVLLNLLLIACLILAYYVKRFRIYYLPESAGALIIGVILGGIMRVTTDRLQPFEFSPELFFFVLLPPIIFEAGYSLNQKDFFDNIGAIVLYAMVGTMISTFVVGGLMFQAATVGLIDNVDVNNPMESLLFGALISAVDPVATLSIMGNAELGCDPLVYSLVFGESVLNDAIAISLFKVFAKYYRPTDPDMTSAQIPAALVSFVAVSVMSVLIGVVLGLAASYMFKHTQLSDYPKLETSLLFCCCYLCYAVAESVGLSGIMALFFQGMVLSHYNSYNLSATAHVASEHIFCTLATVAETAVFLYMGMGVFTGRFENYNFLFSVFALSFCVLGRLLNIFPLSWLANLCRSGANRIPYKMQMVLWFAGLRGAIAFALAMNMPGPNREVYTTATLSICIFTTVVCGGLTEGMLTRFGMKRRTDADGSPMNGTTPQRHEDVRLTPYANGGTHDDDYDDDGQYPVFVRRNSQRVYKGAKRVWKIVEDDILKPHFGGPTNGHHPSVQTPDRADDPRGNYELGKIDLHDDDDHVDDHDTDDDDDHDKMSMNGSDRNQHSSNSSNGYRRTASKNGYSNGA